MAEKKDEELVVVGPGSDEEIRDESEERGEETEEGSDEIRAEGEEDERVGHGTDEEGDDVQDAKRQRRRAEKLRKKENRNRERLELGFLRNRNEQLERRQSELDARVSQGEMVLIDGKISELDGQIREAERLNALAIDKGDGRSATEAAGIAATLRAGRDQLVNVKTQRANAARQAQFRPPQVDPTIVARAQEWAADHEWYDPNLRDADSRVAKAVEEALSQENTFDPRSPEYWAEVDRRLKKYLPKRFSNGNGHDRDDDDDDDDDDRRGGGRQERRSRGPQVQVGGRARPLRKNEVFISAERKEAMMEAGVWNDEVLRNRYLKQFQKYDRDSRRR